MAGVQWPTEAGVCFRVLGPIEIWNGDRSFPAGTLKEQGVLAILLMEAGRVIPAQSLAERLWDEQMPGSARETLQVYVSRLRRRLREAGDQIGLITRSPAGGYRLAGPREQVDAVRFQALLDAARAAAGRNRLDEAVGLLREAEQLWLGEPLSGLPGPWAQATREQLVSKLQAARLVRIDLEMRIGASPDDLIGELAQIVWGGPVNQRAAEQLMLALHGAGRQAEALEVFRRMRRRMRDELGSEPRAQLRTVHQQILAGQPVERPQGAGSGRPALPADTLDRDVVHLVGRDRIVRELVEAIRADQAAGTGAAWYGVDGMAGVGKTALAVNVAHRLREQFPDGLLQASLRAHDPREPGLDVREALVQLLDAMGVDPREMGRAGSTDALGALWRRRTTGLRVLVVLDDVPSFEDIRTLVPTAAGSAVIVTSRRRLLTPAAVRQYTLPPLTDAATIELLERLTGRHMAHEADAAHEVARHCGGLPLATAVAAAYLRAHPGSLADLAERFKANAQAEIDDPLSGPVCMALALSYRELSPPARSLLRRMAVLPGPDAGVHALTALVAESLGRTLIDLDLLTENHLVIEHRPRRYRLHDAVRGFALAQIRHERDGRATDEALARVVEFYTTVTARAEYTVRPHRRAAQRALSRAAAHPDPLFPDRTSAQEWLDSETENLLALAARSGADPAGGELAVLLAKQLDRQGRWRHAASLLTAAMAQRPADELLAAELCVDLATARLRTEEFDDAGNLAHEAFAVFLRHGDVRGQADALHTLGRVHFHGQRLAESDEALRQAAEHFEEIDETRGAHNAYLLRSTVQFERGHHGDALAAAEGAVHAARRLGDPGLLCDALGNLGEMHRRLDRGERALEFFGQADALARMLGDPYSLAVLHHNTAVVHLHTGSFQRAVAGFDAALREFRMLEDRYGQAFVLSGLAEARCASGDAAGAADCLRHAADLVEEFPDPLLGAQFFVARGRLAAAQGQWTRAVADFDEAARHAADAGALLEGMRAYRALAEADEACGDGASAREHRTEADRLAALLHDAAAPHG